MLVMLIMTHCSQCLHACKKLFPFQMVSFIPLLSVDVGDVDVGDVDVGDVNHDWGAGDHWHRHIC